MKNYKVNIDKPKPTQEEILAGRNFDQLLKQYNAAPGKVIKKPFWQSAGFIGSVAAVAATVAIVLMVVSNGNNNPVTNNPQGPVIANNGDNPSSDQTNPTPAWTPTKRKITPPLADVNVPFQQYKVSSKKGGQFTYPTGTKITFKPNSFVDQNGNPVAGNVEVKYREMHDAVDFFLSGIPMEYDSAGATYVLESAGMIEVAAFINGQVVYLDKNKPMEVQMASGQNGTGYNLYEFDTVAGNWVNIGKDKVSAMPVEKKDTVVPVPVSPPQRLCGYVNNVPQEPIEPKKPVKANPSKNRFVVDFNKKEFPEMASFENVILEVDETREKFDQANYNITWDSLNLGRGEGESKYILTLKKGLKKVKLDVYPVLDGEEYNRALAKYNGDMELFVKQKAEYAAWKEAKAKGIDMNNAGQNQIAQNGVSRNGNTWVYTSGGNAADAEMSLDVMRTFSLSSFGLYNMDQAEMLPQGSVLDMTVYGPDGQIFTDFTTVNHVDREKNTVMTYHNQNPMNGFHCNTRSSNLMWAVKNGELYYAENDAFSGLPLSGKVVLTLKKVGKKLKSAEEMRAFFGIKAPQNAQ